MIHFVVVPDEESCMSDYLGLWGRGLTGRLQIVHYQELLRRMRLEPGAYILAALDRLNPALDRLVRQMHGRVAETPGIRFLNDPTRTLRRFELLTELRRRGLNEFGAVRAADDPGRLRYPVFVRSERDHDGALSGLLHSAPEVEAAIGLALVRGRRLQDLLVVEFCPTSDAGGFYRKYAAFVVGRRIIPRSLAYGRDWVLKFGGTHYTRAMLEEELDYVVGNPHEAQLAEIFELAGAEYGRIDYAMKDGRIQTWEINLNPKIGRGLRPSRSRVPPELEPIRSQVKECFYGRFQAAFEAIDLPSEGPAVDLKLEPAELEAALAAQAVQAGRGGVLRALKRVLMPAKPVLKPLVLHGLSALERLTAPLLRRLVQRARSRQA